MAKLKGVILQLNQNENYGTILVHSTREEFFFYPNEVAKAKTGDRVEFVKDEDYTSILVAAEVEIQLLRRAV